MSHNFKVAQIKETQRRLQLAENQRARKMLAAATSHLQAFQTIKRIVEEQIETEQRISHTKAELWTKKTVREVEKSQVATRKLLINLSLVSTEIKL